MPPYQYTVLFWFMPCLMNSFLGLWVNFSSKVAHHTAGNESQAFSGAALCCLPCLLAWKELGLSGWAAWRKMLPNSWQLCSSYGGGGCQKWKTESWLWGTQHTGLQHWRHQDPFLIKLKAAVTGTCCRTSAVPVLFATSWQRPIFQRFYFPSRSQTKTAAHLGSSGHQTWSLWLGS